MTLGDYIKEYREGQGLSQRKFSDLCGLSNAYISVLEQNVNPKTGEAPAPTYGVYQKVARAMGIDVQTLMERCPDSKVSIGSKMTLQITSAPIHSDVIDMLEDRANVSDEDEELKSLWKTASPAAKKAALAVLKSMQETGG